MDKDQPRPTHDGVSFELLAAAVAATDAGVIICDRALHDTPIVFANDAFGRITGYAREEILGRNCRFLQGAGTDRAELARLRAAIEAGQPVEVELLNYRKDGGAFWNALRIAPVADGEARPRFLVGVQHDVTERRLAQDALRASEAKVRATQEHASVGIAEIDAAGRFLVVNAALCGITGYPREELLGRGIFDVTHPEDATAEAVAYARLVEGADRGYRIEKRHLCKDGGERWVEVASTAVRDAAGGFLYCVQVVQDLHERRLAEARIRHLAYHDPLTACPTARCSRTACSRRWCRPAATRSRSGCCCSTSTASRT